MEMKKEYTEEELRELKETLDKEKDKQVVAIVFALLDVIELQKKQNESAVRSLIFITFMMSTALIGLLLFSMYMYNQMLFMPIMEV